MMLHFLGALFLSLVVLYTILSVRDCASGHTRPDKADQSPSLFLEHGGVTKFVTVDSHKQLPNV